MICSTEHILKLCSWHIFSRSGTLAISPSSLTTSMMTADGFRPASLHRSTEPSVCPVRARTPPSRARSGLMWPGRTKSSGLEFVSTSSSSVFTRSAAEIPVLTLWRGWPSTLIVNGVPRTLVFSITCGPSSRRSQSSPVIATQRYPPPTRVRKLIRSTLMCSVATTKSPSFSRSSSSIKTITLPNRNSSNISSIVANAIGVF